MLAIYTRLSQEDDESNSISNQLREGEAFAEKHNLKYIIYNEGEGVSGRNDIGNRPQLELLINEILEGKITHFWCRQQNRLERNSYVFHLFAEAVKKFNVEVYIGGVHEDWNDPNTFLKSAILSLFNSFQANIQSHITKKALIDNAKEGKSFGVYPYGYTSVDGYFKIDEEESKVVKKIYELSLNGMGVRSIAELLNEDKVPTRYNKIGKGTLTVKNKYTGKLTTIKKKDIEWSGNSVRGIIVNTFYKGERKWGDKYYKVPAIFDEEYWQKVNDNLKNNSNNRGKKVLHKYLLKGLLRCGKCGRNMYGRSRVNKKDHYYQCSSKRKKNGSCGNRSINIDKIEGVIWSRFFKGDELLKLIEQDINKDENEILKLQDDLTKYEKSIKDSKNELSNLVKAVAKGLLDEEDVISNRNRIKGDIKDKELLIKEINKQIANAKNNSQLSKEYNEEFDKFKGISEIQKKEIFNRYIKDIIVHHTPNSVFDYILIIKFKVLQNNEYYAFNTKFNILLSLSDKAYFSSKHIDKEQSSTFKMLNLDFLENIYIGANMKIHTFPNISITAIQKTINENSLESLDKIKDSDIPDFTISNPNVYENLSDFGIDTLDKKREYKNLIEVYRNSSNSNENILKWIEFVLKKGHKAHNIPLPKIL